MANYTWAKTLDIVSADQYNNGIGIVDSRNPRLDKGNSDGQPRHLFTLSGLYQLPGTSHFGFVGSRILSGWQVNGILTANSGSPFNVTSGVDTNLDGINNDRPNLIGNATPAGGGGLTNATLQKNFQINDRNRVAFRWEAFNALNHTNFSTPTANLSSANFGRITSSGAARIMQFALRYSF